MDFTGKTAVITGGASGMGLLLSQRFTDLGGNVVMCDVNEAALAEKEAEINALGKGRAKGIVCDVRDYAQVTAACQKAVETFGSIDVMCNFAGGSAVRIKQVDREKYPEFPDVPMEVYDWGLDVNLKGPFYFDHAVLKQMRKQKSGLIVNIGSVAGVIGNGFAVDYAVAKAGVIYGLTKSLAQYGAPYGIRCVCVSPGPVLTRAAMGKMATPLGRAATPEEVINLVLYLASEDGGFITGDNFIIDGGMNAVGVGM